MVKVLSGASLRNAKPTRIPANKQMIIQPARLILRFFLITVPPIIDADIVAYIFMLIHRKKYISGNINEYFAQNRFS